jgi:PTS hybrid protein
MSYVGIVLVSHSKDLAFGLQQLLLQVQPEVPVAVAGGTDEDEIGTSAFKIKRAIESVYTDKGVVLLFDLGSSLINAEMAIEWLEDKDQIRIADAPLVEGAYVAIVESGCGKTMNEVADLAQEAKSLSKLSG